MPDKPRLVSSEPPPEMERAVLRVRSDAMFLWEHMTPSQVCAAYLILERARDDLSKTLERCKVFHP